MFIEAADEAESEFKKNIDKIFEKVEKVHQEQKSENS
jgi:hypothetical protein